MYLFIDIEEIYYNNRISQINSEIYEQYYNMISNCKEINFGYVRFINMYSKKSYSIPRNFDTINIFASDICKKS